MSSIEVETEVGPTEPAVTRTVETESDIARLVNEFPQDASDEAFAQALKKSYQCKRLRAACTQLGLHPQADPSMNHKEGYISLLGAYRRAKQRGETFSGFSKSKAKPKKRVSNYGIGGRTKHCGFKLINVVFSPAFIVRMAESGALPSTGLEVGLVDGRAKYWRDVATAYDSENPAFFRIAGPAGRYEDIDPRLASHHSPAKLCAIWKDMTTKYEDSFARWKQLGTDSVGFAHFCGDLDVMYLHDRLQMQPIQVEVDPERLRASKRARTERTQQISETASIDTESESESKSEDEHAERGTFLTPRELEVPMQHPVSSANGLPEPLQRRVNSNFREVRAPTQRQECSGAELRQRQLLPRSDAVRISVQRQDARSGAPQEAPAQRRELSVREERLQQPLNADPERSRVNAFEGVIYSSQAVRDAMAAIEALKRGRFDNSVIAQAEESLDAIVQVWLGNLAKAAQPRTGS